MAKDPNNILGIYNYCDGWCERCTFTSRCLTYKTHAKFEEEIEQERREEENKAFWDQVDEAVEDVKDLLDEKQEEDADFGFTGFDDIDDDDVEDAMKEHENHRKKANDQPISKAGSRYMKIARNFFKQRESKLVRSYSEEGRIQKITVEGIGDELTLRRIGVAIEIAYYYHIQIWVKVNRALTSSYDDFENDEEYADMPKDSDGSAKVALLGIDQSIGAWTTLYKYLESDQKEIAEILSLLRQLRNGIERVFPNARAFVRPGFDD